MGVESTALASSVAAVAFPPAAVALKAVAVVASVADRTFVADKMLAFEFVGNIDNPEAEVVADTHIRNTQASDREGTPLEVEGLRDWIRPGWVRPLRLLQLGKVRGQWE